MTILESGTLSESNPWPGMRPYRETDAPFFFGRDEEIADLIARIERSRLTVLYAQAGIGKTSLLRAGLAPMLFSRRFMPVYLRPRGILDAPAKPAQEVIRAIEAAVKEHNVEATASFDAPSLWEFFYRADFDLWDTSNCIVVPVLMFDQFEEFFQMLEEPGAAIEEIRSLLEDLADLVENRMPARLARIDLPESDAQRFDLRTGDCRIIFSFGEDYLPHVRELRPIMPSVVENHFRLEPLNGKKAMRVMFGAGRNIMTADAAATILREIGKPSGVLKMLSPANAEDAHGSAAGLAEFTVDPPILSAVCFYHNEQRRQRKLEEIDTPLVKEKKTADIFKEYYRSATVGIDSRTRSFLETELLTAGGRRVLYPLGELDQAGMASERSIEQLIKNGILRREWFGEEEHLEVSHDLLIEPIQEARRQRLVRRRIALAGAATILILVIAGWLVESAMRAAEESRQARESAMFSAVVNAFPVAEHDRLTELMTGLMDATDAAAVAQSGKTVLLFVHNRAKAGGFGPARENPALRSMIELLQARLDRVPRDPGQTAELVGLLAEEVRRLCERGFVVVANGNVDNMVKWFGDHGAKVQCTQP